MSDEPELTPLDQLKAAIQKWVSSCAEKPSLLDNAIVIWEQISYTEDGELERSILYTVPTDNFTMSGTLGLLVAGDAQIKRDLLDPDPE